MKLTKETLTKMVKETIKEQVYTKDDDYAYEQKLIDLRTELEQAGTLAGELEMSYDDQVLDSMVERDDWKTQEVNKLRRLKMMLKTIFGLSKEVF